MTNLFAARAQMALSLGFHIVFAEIGIAMPVLMVLAEWRWRKTGDDVYRQLARRWAKGTAVLFAVGAVSGTVLSVELGLLWPTFMRFAGPIIGIPFSLEGFAFFTEAIFLGVYLYGWEKISARAHLMAGVIVAISGAASAVFVVMVNAWMNTPTGITMDGTRVVAVDPIAGMFNPSTVQQAIHMLIAAYAATGFAVAGIHAAILLKKPGSPFHLRALTLALVIAAPAAILQPISGDLSARVVAEWQPVKLAALESHFTTMRGAPLHVGGWPSEVESRTKYALEIPRGLSLLAFHDPDAEVKGLSDFPRDMWPPIAPVHVAFQLMVALGTAMALIGVWVAVAYIRKWVAVAHMRKTTRHGHPDPSDVHAPDMTAAAGHHRIADSRLLLRALAIAAPFGFIATEAGWTVTEVGRQPWVVNGLVRTADAVTPMPGLVYPMTIFTLLYIGLAAVVVLVVRSIVKETT